MIFLSLNFERSAWENSKQQFPVLINTVKCRNWYSTQSQSNIPCKDKLLRYCRKNICPDTTLLWYTPILIPALVLLKCLFHLSYLCEATFYMSLNSLIQQGQYSWLNATLRLTILTRLGSGIQQPQPRESYYSKFMRADVAPSLARLRVVFGTLELSSYSRTYVFSQLHKVVIILV